MVDNREKVRNDVLRFMMGWKNICNGIKVSEKRECIEVGLGSRIFLGMKYYLVFKKEKEKFLIVVLR